MEQQKLNFDEALEASRANNVFTTHTPVPAGIDLFDSGMMHYYFREYCLDAGIDVQSVDVARPPQSLRMLGERFSMAVLAFKTSSYRNTVSRLHRRVAQEMWHELWPDLPIWEVPLTSITNGVHMPSWLNGDLADLYDQYLEPDWREHTDDPKTWELVDRDSR